MAQTEFVNTVILSERNEEPRRKQRGIGSNGSNNRSKLRGINPVEIKAMTIGAQNSDKQKEKRP